MPYDWHTPLAYTIDIRTGYFLRLRTLADAVRFLNQRARVARNDEIQVIVGMLSVAALVGDKECVRVATEQLESFLKVAGLMADAAPPPGSLGPGQGST